MDQDKKVLSELRPHDASTASIIAGLQIVHEQLESLRHSNEELRRDLEAHIELLRKYKPYLDDKLEERKLWRNLRFSVTDKLLVAIVIACASYVFVAIFQQTN